MILTLCFISALALSAENLSEGPWYNRYINGLNRLPAHVTSYSYKTADEALACDREASRIESLNGTWKFMFAADTKAHIRGEKIERTMDQVREKFGSSAIGFAAVLDNDIGAYVRDYSNEDSDEDADADELLLFVHLLYHIALEKVKRDG